MRFRSALISAVILLAVFLGLLGYIHRYQPVHRAKPDAGEPVGRLYPALEADQIDDIRITRSGGETAEARRMDGTWKVVGPTPPVAADYREIRAITEGLALIEVDRVVDERPTDLGQFGLFQPRIEISFKTSGSNDFRTLQVGDKSGLGDHLYAREPQGTRVFLIRDYLGATFDKRSFDLRDKVVLVFAREEVTRIEISGGPSLIVIAKERYTGKEGYFWKLTSPIPTTADFPAVEGLISQVQQTMMQSIEAGTDADAARYGLDKPAYKIDLTLGSAHAQLGIGKAAKNDATEYYAKDGSRPQVFTVPSALVEHLKSDAATYRNKDLFESRAYLVTKARIQRNGTTLEVWQEHDKWRQRSLVAQDLDAGKVEAALVKWVTLRANSFVDDASDRPSVYGLDKPILTVTLWFDGGRRHETVAFGKGQGGIVYAKRADDPFAVTVDASLYDQAVKESADLK